MKTYGIASLFVLLLFCLAAPAMADYESGLQPVEKGIMIGMANPAAVWAEEMGYEYSIRTDEEGNQYGVCILPDGSEVDAWQLYYDAHQQGEEPVVDTRTPLEIFAAEHGYGGNSLASDRLDQYRASIRQQNMENLLYGQSEPGPSSPGHHNLMFQLLLRHRNYQVTNTPA